MGLFGKKNTIEDFKRDLIQHVALAMFSMKITKMPSINFLKGDPGILRRYTTISLTDQASREIARQDYGLFLRILACHAFGAGVVAVFAQNKYSKSVAEFSDSEVSEVIESLMETDAYELGLNSLGFSATSNNKKVLDHIFIKSLESIGKDYNKELKNDTYLYEFMEVYFNAGVTMIYGT
jgi:hypothetical protein